MALGREEGLELTGFHWVYSAQTLEKTPKTHPPRKLSFAGVGTVVLVDTNPSVNMLRNHSKRMNILFAYYTVDALARSWPKCYVRSTSVRRNAAGTLQTAHTRLTIGTQVNIVTKDTLHSQGRMQT
ncbi:unnamed protein product [Peniophora sp. CBMAI 1063]|nr:unnamed protein product [Peniophora sp. CBMAI 1063]